MRVALLGMLTGIGGGMVRDLLVNEIPVVLRVDLYTLAGACGRRSGRRRASSTVAAAATTVVGVILCFGLRVIAIRRGWNLPPSGIPLAS